MIITDVTMSTDVPQLLRAYYSQQLITTGEALLAYAMHAEAKGPEGGAPGLNAGTTVVFTVIQNLPPTTAPLSEYRDVGGIELVTSQHAVSVQEYGTAVGVTEKLNLTSAVGPVTDIIKTMLAPQMALTRDILARNAVISGAQWRRFPGTATSRAQIGTIGSENHTLTPELVREAAFALNTRLVQPFSSPNGYVAIIHPAQAHDLRAHPFWINVNQYTRPDLVLNGEIGTLFGVRFVQTTVSRLPNAGAQTARTTLTQPVHPNQQHAVVAATTGLQAGMEVTLHADASGPNGIDPTEEHLVIDRIDGNRLIFRAKATMPHEVGDYVTEGRDIFPVVFLGATPSLGYARVLEPEVRFAAPTDKLGRRWHIGWYGIFGYGLIRPWAVQYLETAASVTTLPAFPW
jgi:N4-gp56 family major capsid protein